MNRYLNTFQISHFWRFYSHVDICWPSPPRFAPWVTERQMVQITFSIYFKSQNKLWKWVQHPKISIFTCITHLSMPNRIFFIFLAIFGKFRQKTSKISILCTFFSLALDWSFKCNPRRIQKVCSEGPLGGCLYTHYTWASNLLLQLEISSVDC